MFFNQVGESLIFSFQQMWASVFSVLPSIVGAIILFVIGMVVATALGKAVEHILRALRIDHILSQLEAEKMLEKAGFKIRGSAFIGGLVKWFVVIVFLLACANVLGLTQVSEFLRDVLLYLPNVAIAAFILVVATILADVAERIVRASVDSAGYRGALVGFVVRWSIWVFSFIAVLLQLGVAITLIQTLLTGMVAALALAFGLSFGLGGKDVAADILHRMKDEIRR
jgi:small-conductance mechanosensitive channel